MSIDFTSKPINKYFCLKCDFKCSKKGDYNRHNLTIKHKINTLSTDNNQSHIKPYCCDICKKEFGDRSGLWRHKKKCTPTATKLLPNDTNMETNEKYMIIDKELVMMLFKQNTELLEIVKNGTCNNNHVNSHNKSFNLQFFLNETCKDAMNIMDFVDSIQLQLSDLENVGEVGYVNGISNIIVKHLNDLDVTKRPVHCTDKKREVIYIKDDNTWEKEDEEKNKMRKVIKKVANKNIRLLQKFKEVHPDCGKSDSKYSDQYNKIIVESMGGPGDNDREKENKIIKNISKNVHLTPPSL